MRANSVLVLFLLPMVLQDNIWFIILQEEMKEYVQKLLNMEEHNNNNNNNNNNNVVLLSMRVVLTIKIIIFQLYDFGMCVCL